jgi:hypothetical protein
MDWANTAEKIYTSLQHERMLVPSVLHFPARAAAAGKGSFGYRAGVFCYYKIFKVSHR